MKIYMRGYDQKPQKNKKKEEEFLCIIKKKDEKTVDKSA